MVCCFGNIPLTKAAPVDLTPPRNSIGYADKDGYFRIVERFGQIRFSNDFLIPLRFEFWTGREGDDSVSPYGWDGWHCGPLESTIENYGGEKFLRATLLCAKHLYLEKDATDPTVYRSVDRSWEGHEDGERIRVSRNDGWELVFHKGVVESLRTDRGALIHWVRSESGRLLKIEEEGEAIPALVVKWKGDDPNSGLVDKLILPDRVISVDVRRTPGADRSHFGVSWPQGEAVAKVVMDRTSSSLEMVKKSGMIRRFEWDAETRMIRSDGINSYTVEASEGSGSTISMVNRSGVSQSRRYDNANSAVIVKTPEGVTNTLFRLAVPVPGSPGIDRIEVGDEPGAQVVLRNIYNDSGLIERREWRGKPSEWSGYRGGKIEPELEPDPEVTYPISGLKAVSDSGVMTIIEFGFDEKRRHITTRVGNTVVLRKEYSIDGKVVAIERIGRFTRRFTYESEKVTEALELPEIGGEPYAFVGGDDESVTEDLVVFREFTTDGRITFERYLDGSSRRYSYDANGRSMRDERFGRDASNPALSIQYVYSPDGGRVGEIEEDLLTGKTSYFVRDILANGVWDHRSAVPRLDFR